MASTSEGQITLASQFTDAFIMRSAEEVVEERMATAIATTKDIVSAIALQMHRKICQLSERIYDMDSIIGAELTKINHMVEPKLMIIEEFIDKFVIDLGQAHHDIRLRDFEFKKALKNNKIEITEKVADVLSIVQEILAKMKTFEGNLTKTRTTVIALKDEVKHLSLIASRSEDGIKKLLGHFKL